MSLKLHNFLQARDTAWYSPIKQPGEDFFECCEDWETFVSNVLRGLPNGTAELSRFRAVVGANLPSVLKTKFKRPFASSSVDTNALVANRTNYVTQVDQLAETVFDTTTIPGPGPAFADAEYQTAVGIICIGTINSPNQNAMGTKWLQRKTYSGNYDGHANDLVIKPVNQDFQYRNPGAVRNVDDARTVKNLPGMQLLSATRHAEDGWFARYLTEFRDDLQTVLQGATAPTYDCNESIIEQVQEATKIIFVVSANPCLSDDRVGDTGCMHYFGRLLRPNAAQFPIIIYWHRPYDPAVGKGKRLATIDSDGEYVIHKNGWS